MKRILALAMSVLLTVTAMPVGVLADTTVDQNTTAVEESVEEVNTLLDDEIPEEECVRALEDAPSEEQCEEVELTDTKDDVVSSESADEPGVSADEPTETVIANGICGDDLTWKLTDTGTLYIEGTGLMTSRTGVSAFEWDEYSLYIRSVKINDGVSSIGSWAFEDCSSLTSVTIPNSVTSIEYAAFSGCSSLTSVTIPNSVTSIGHAAFFGCSSLTSVTIPNSVTSIEYAAFSGCSSLTEIEIPNSVTSIGSDAFSGCSSLTEMEIPHSVTSIGPDAFSGCSSLTEIEIPNSLPSDVEIDFDGCNKLVRYKEQKDGTYAIRYYDKTLTSVVVPCEHKGKTITSLDHWAFEGCSSLTSVTVPNSVTFFGAYAFDGCSSLLEIEIPNSTTSIMGGTFKDCSSLTSVTIPNGVTMIGGSAFSGCSSLTEIEIPNSVTSIWGSAFSGCSSLSSATIPYSLANKIGRDVFNGCDKLMRYDEKEDGTYSIRCYDRTLIRIDIPRTHKGKTITSIEDCAFDGCSSLTCVTIPNSVVSIGDAAFSGCKKLVRYDEQEDGSYSIRCYDKNPISVTIPDGVTNIDSWAFSGCSNLTSVTIPDSVKNIGSGAFHGCSSLTEIEIPNSVISIDSQAFSDCSNLTSVTIPDSVKNIGDYAFSGCSSLMSVTIPNGVTSIGIGAFNGCDKLVRYDEQEDGTYSIRYYDKTLTSVNIPSTHNGKTITSIGHDAFSRCNSLTSVTIPKSVTNIEGAFDGCDKLVRYDEQEDGTYSIRYYDTTLTSVTIPSTHNGKTITSIGNYAFSRCSSLTSVTIPNSVRKIGFGAFDGCDKLVRYDEQEDGTYSIRYYDKTLTSVTIPSTYNGKAITSIGSSAFWGCSGLTEIEIPNSVTSIGLSAFKGCSGLTEIEIPNSVTSIENCAFEGCSSLTSVTIPNSVTSIGTAPFNRCDKLVRYDEQEDGTYSIRYYDKTLTSVAIPSTHNGKAITSIGGYAFSGCSSLTSVTIPNSVTSIGEYAFKGCNSLTEIEIPDSVTNIGRRAFDGCSYLVRYDEQEDGTYSIRYYDTTLTSVTIPSTHKGKAITSIGGCAFIGFSNLTSVTIPNSVTNISESAFWGCSSLTEIEIPGSVTSIGNYAFKGCSSLTSATIPNSVTHTSESVFSDCSNLVRYDEQEDGTYSIRYYDKTLTSVTIPSTHKGKAITSIGKYAFSGCSSLTSVTLPNSVTSIGASAFSGCSSLTEIDIPDNVTSIERYAFANCSSLTEIEVPDSVTIIGEHAFSGCSSLTSMRIPNSVTSIGKSAFRSCSSLTSVTISNKVTSIEESAFYDCRRLTEIDIPDSVTRVEESAFAHCSSLTSVTISNKVTSIEDSAFSDCRRLTEIDIPDSVTNIGRYAFAYCSSLTSVTIPNSVTRVEESAFAHCSSLTEIEIPDSVTSIGSNAFKECNNLRIKCRKNTAAEDYAIQNGINYGYIACEEHSWDDGAVTKEATYIASGEKTFTCSECDEIRTEIIEKMEKVSLSKCTVSLSFTKKTYSGSALKPTVVVKNGSKTVSSSYYSVTYSNNKNVGRARVTITAKSGNIPYTGSISKNFVIVPKGTSVAGLSAASQAFTVKWKKQATQTSGYQVQYSTGRKFSSYKTVTVSDASTVSKKISKLTAKKKYYVRIRTYKTVSGKNYYSGWSTAKYVTTKV